MRDEDSFLGVARGFDLGLEKILIFKFLLIDLILVELISFFLN